MSNHKILYVNEKSNDKLKGFVKTRNNLIYNLHCIHPATAEKFTETIVEYQKGTVVSIAGRFICIVTMGLIDKQEGMLIIDLQNDTTKLKETIQKFSNPKVTERINSAFEAIKSSPQEYYDFEMEVGDAPTPE